MSKKSASGAPKKARWSTEKKSAAAKKPHRGQGGPAGHTSAGHTGRTSRPASATSSHVGGREWRAPRDEYRSDRSDRDSRGGYQRRDDRPAFKRDDRGD
ncbi:MAG: DEAD/DEAH box helicase, partial [Humibacillus sp.]|nr:DEAD/DEAH box helicase [Humibacillus sp.]MDN5779923.1 DEAD/DEAH box helicase [Humibacillus sp.]